MGLLSHYASLSPRSLARSLARLELCATSSLSLCAASQAYDERLQAERRTQGKAPGGAAARGAGERRAGPSIGPAGPPAVAGPSPRPSEADEPIGPALPPKRAAEASAAEGAPVGPAMPLAKKRAGPAAEETAES